MVFPVVVYGCESWTVKKAESEGIGAFELWCWRRLLRVPWTAKRCNQSILRKISPDFWKDWCWSWTPILWPPDAKNWLIWKDPDAGNDWRHEEKGTTKDEMVGGHHCLNGRESEQAPGVGDGQGSLRSQRVRHKWATELNGESGHSFQCRAVPTSKPWLLLLYKFYPPIRGETSGLIYFLRFL